MGNGLLGLGLFKGPLESCGDAKKATEIFSQTFSDLYENSSRIRTFLEIAKKGIPLAAQEVHKEDLATARHMYHYFRQRAEKGKKPKGYKKQAFDQTIKKATSTAQSIDAAGIVFAHSMLDSTLSGLCRAIAYNRPVEWKSFLASKRTTLGDVMEGKSHGMIKDAFENLLLSFEYRSMTQKADILFQVCKPQKFDLGPTDYKFSKQKLKSLDKLRHEIVHPTSSPSAVRAVKDWVTFAYNTGMYFIDMAHMAQELYVDERQMLSFIFSTGAMRRHSAKQKVPIQKVVG